MRRRKPYTLALRKHPQVYSQEVTVEVFRFRCSKCFDEGDYKRAKVQPDGRLWCWSCNYHYDGPDLMDELSWCPRCRETYQPSWEQDHDCRSEPPKPAPTCEQCGDTFTPARSDAKYCSARCRVAAHRQRT